jgi:hypothetical protein
MSRMPGAVWLLFMLLVLFGGSPALADDAPLAGIGGAYQPMQRGVQVRMAREWVNVTLSARGTRTVVQFDFRNEGPAQTVTMGFPEKAIYPPNDKPGGSYRHFTRRVDGRPITARPTSWQEVQEKTAWQRWWVSRVYFARNQTRVVRVSYDEAPNFLMTPGGRSYGYILGTGSYWAGPVGSVDFVFDVKDFPADTSILASELERSGSGVTRRGNRLASHFRGWKPPKDLELQFLVFPGITYVRVNKDLDISLPGNGNWFHVENGQLVGNIGNLGYVGRDRDDNTKISWNKISHTASLEHGGKTLVLRAGSKEATLLPDHKIVMLPLAPYLLDDELRVPIRCVLEATGRKLDIRQDKLGNYEVTILDPKFKI